MVPTSIIPTIMVLDREPDCEDDVLNMELDGDTLIIHALEDITISIIGGDYPTGTLRFKAGMVIMLPIGLHSN